MNFDETTNYLYSLGNEVAAMKLGLESIGKLLAALRRPQNKYLKVQIAGTNGKGSVCAFLDAICISAGIKTGRFTSPHLISITERIKIAGVDIGDADFARHATTVRATAETLVKAGELESIPTFFEQVTAIALLAFADAGIELAILETGLGGRLDATTAANAEIVAITRIDLDHQEYLGETIEEIAAEKAAIIRPGTRVVIGDQQSEAMDVIIRRCRQFGIKPQVTTDAAIDIGRNPTGREGVSFATTAHLNDNETHSLPLVFPPLDTLGLLGRHQVENARVAILVAEILKADLPITKTNIDDGLKTARHPGRLEYRGQYLFDGAHNIAGATVLRQYLDEFVSKPVTLIFGAMKEKDVAAIAEQLFPKAKNLILTRPDNSRALTAGQLAAFVSADHEALFLTSNVPEAIEIAKEVTPDDGLILITGSLYLVGEVKTIMKNVAET